MGDDDRRLINAVKKFRASCSQRVQTFAFWAVIIPIQCISSEYSRISLPQIDDLTARKYADANFGKARFDTPGAPLEGDGGGLHRPALRAAKAYATDPFQQRRLTVRLFNAQRRQGRIQNALQASHGIPLGLPVSH
ncbi:hypothetical protein IE00_19425 [Paracoccus sp. SM22M-07]|nr:hypothetical protein IE00_19425 [Paracoccus sp. SM22M-07]